MPAHKPEECDLQLLEALKAGDLDAAMAMYEPDATFVVSPEQVVTGHAAIREVMQGFINAQATFNVEAVTAVPSTDGTVAVTRVKGSSTSPGPDGNPVTTPLHSVEVVRKQADGTWLFHRRRPQRRRREVKPGRARGGAATRPALLPDLISRRCARLGQITILCSRRRITSGMTGAERLGDSLA